MTAVELKTQPASLRPDTSVHFVRLLHEERDMAASDIPNDAAVIRQVLESMVTPPPPPPLPTPTHPPEAPRRTPAVMDVLSVHLDPHTRACPSGEHPAMPQHHRHPLLQL